MYQVKGKKLRLQDILEKLRANREGVDLPSVSYTPIKYSKLDIIAAKNVLERLLSTPPCYEISYIKVIPEESNE